MRYKLALVLAVGLGALATAPAAFAGWEDTGICDVLTDFPTIQAAIDEPRCLTVRLPATREGFEFKEQLNVWRGLTITGQSFTLKEELERTKIVTRLHPPDVMVGSNVLINVSGARTRLKLKHIVIEGPATGDGLVGLRAERDTRVTVSGCVFRNMRPPTPDGRWGFMAIHVGGPLQPKAKVGISGHAITGCRIEGYENAAIVVEGAGTTAVISENIISGAAEAAGVRGRPAHAAQPFGVFLLDGASVTIDRNDVVNNSRDGGGGMAIFFQGGAEGSVISYNNIDRNDLGIGIAGTNSVKIFRNALFDNDTGIALGGSEPSAASNLNTLQLNRVEGGRFGLLLGHSSANALSSNDLLGNDADGAILSENAVKNKLYRNRAQGNSNFGYYDSSRGTGTAGTANTYTSNLCTGNNGGGDQSSPGGTCR